MRNNTLTTIIFISLLIPTVLLAQPRFEVPLVITDGVATDTLYWGMVPGAHVCIYDSDCINGHCEFFLPIPPPGGYLDMRFYGPPGRRSCFDSGSPYDYRPYTSPLQRDTFSIGVYSVTVGRMITMFWPSNLSTYFTELMIGGVNALRDTSINSPGDYGVTYTIISGGLVVAGVNEDPPREAPRGFDLFQNYPNPFNPSTVIRFHLPAISAQSGQAGLTAYSYVSLKVYDVLGREVATLVAGSQQPGQHTVEWSADGLPSGVYIYRLAASGTTVSKKMLLLR